MGRRAGSAMRRVTIILVAFAALACAANASPTVAPSPTAPSSPTAPPSPAVSPSPTAPPSPTATVSAAPVTPGSQRVLVAGTQDCSIDDPMSSETNGQVTTYNGTLRCVDTVSDPRVSGQEVGDVTLVETELPDLHIDRWSVEMTLTNAGGTWAGTGWGSEFWDDRGDLRTSGAMLYIGHGAYEGLQYRVLIAQSPDWQHYIMTGWIEPAQ